MKLKKLILADITILAVVVVSVLALIQLNPSLESRRNEQIGMYNEKRLFTSAITLNQGEIASTEFNSTSYEPVVLVITLVFQNWSTPGYVSIYCNGRDIVTLLASPQNPQITLEAMTFANIEWVGPPSAYSSFFTNSLQFASTYGDGFEGSLLCQISLRGTR